MLVQAVTTAFFAVVVFVAGQFVVKFVIEPVHEQSKVIGEIAYALVFYANIYSSPGQGLKEEMDRTRHPSFGNLRVTLLKRQWLSLGIGYGQS